jgi:BlaI family transcriptional regulator, penicillinase repressor
MKSVPRISEAEWEIMKAAWEGFPCSADEIIARLERLNRNWHPKTTRTLLNRLVKKKVLGFRKEARTYFYFPLVKEKDCIDAASASFLDRVFGGSLKPMLAHFVEHKRLSPAEIQELKELLNHAED